MTDEYTSSLFTFRSIAIDFRSSNRKAAFDRRVRENGLRTVFPAELGSAASEAVTRRVQIREAPPAELRQ